MFVVFYTVNLDICVFVTCSTSYCLSDTLMDPWNVCMCVCVCVCVYDLKFILDIFLVFKAFYSCPSP